MMPARFSGSLALMRTISPVRSSRRTRRSAIDRLRQRVLLADEARDEAAAAHDAARLLPPQRAHDVAPRHREVLARDEVAEDDAVAREQLHRQLSPPVRPAGDGSGWKRCTIDQRPCGAVARGSRAPP